MKTFQEFILEAAGDVAKEIAMLRAKANAAKQKGDMKTFLELQMQAGELQAGTQDKIRALTSDKPRTSSNPNSITGGGYAQTGRRGRIGPDSASSVGTVPNSRRRRVFDMNTGRDLGPADPSDVRIKNKYTDDTYGGRGTGDSRSGGKIGR
jgi:hypothetical protein